jgi:hypothetical protein
MAKTIRQRLDALHTLAPELNQVVDEANRVVADTERELLEMGIGISVVSSSFAVDKFASRDDEDDGEEFMARRCLAFARTPGGGYSIHILTQKYRKSDYGTGDPFASDTIPWSGCPREVRLAAFEKLPELLDKLISEAKRRVGTARRVQTRVQKMIEGADDRSLPDRAIAGRVAR